MFKKHLCIILTAILLFSSLSSCGSGATTTSQKPTSSISSVKSSNESTAENVAPEVTAQIAQESSSTVFEETEKIESPTTVPETDTSAPKPLGVHFIDVGQADSILIKASDKTMLIDAGNNADGPNVVSYLKNQGISKIDVLVGTHPHEDHIGGMDNVINSFTIGQIYMPKVSHTTKTYEDVLTAIKNKGLKVTAPTPGTIFDIGGAKCTILAPNSSSYDDLNNYSIVIKLEHRQTSFLFAGDAEDVSEQEMLNKGLNLSADVLKVGHHGSNSSTTAKFLSAVSPKFAVISVGKDNDYGHPHIETLDKLNAAGIQIYRTDEVGTIIATSDGKSITFDKNASPVKENAPPVEINEDNQESELTSNNTVYITKTGEKYHRDGCRYLSNSKIPIGLDTAIASGYTPCSICDPPVSSDSSTKIENTKSFQESKASSSNTEEKKETIVYITKTGEKYHLASCSYLRKSSIPIELSVAKNSGYTPCSRCNPPR